MAGSSSIFFKCIGNKPCLWPALLKFSFQADLEQEISANYHRQERQMLWFFSPWSRVGHALRPIFMFWLVKIWQVSSCGKCLQDLETCLLWAKADRFWCHLVMFLTAFFHWIYKMKYSCYQDSSAIHGWFVYWVMFGWELRCLSESSEIRFFVFHLACKREWSKRANPLYMTLFPWKLFSIYSWFCVILRGYFKDATLLVG